MSVTFRCASSSFLRTPRHHTLQLNFFSPLGKILKTLPLLKVAEKGERLSPGQFTHQGAKISLTIHFPMTKGLIAKRDGLFCSVQKMFLLKYLLSFCCKMILKLL